MSLGRVYPGRLPSTQADIDLINHRIQIVNQQMKQLDQMVATGNIDNREAAYRRQYLSGEVLELKAAIKRMRLSTPSYKVPRDLQAHVAKKPQNKMWSPETTRDELPQGYFGTDNGQKINSIPSDWTPTELTDFDVPDVKGQPGWHRGDWPAHWPGSHSPSINRAVMQAGEINGRQVIDPRDPNMQLRLNLVERTSHMSQALQIKARYEQLYEITVANPIFTPTDQTLVNIIIGKINRQITDAEAEIANRKATGGYKDLSDEQHTASTLAEKYKGFTIMVNTVTDRDSASIIRKEYSAANATIVIPDTMRDGFASVSNINQLYQLIDNYVAANKTMGGSYIKHNSTTDGPYVQKYVPGGSYKAIRLAQETRNDGKYNWKLFYDGKWMGLAYNNQAQPMTKSQWESTWIPWFKTTFFNGQNNEYAINGHPKVKVVLANNTKEMRAYDAFGFLKRNPRMARRTGRLMGLGAMQAADRNRALTTPRGQVTPSQQASYNATLREMTMARARAGASLDVNQQIREQAVTRPWSIQVTLPGETVQMLHNMMDISLAQAGLTQDMFTQQAHDYVASIINSLDSSMTPTQQTEYVVERIMSEMVNRSALLKRDVNVDINMEQQQVTFNEVNGLSGGFLKTKAALGRLLG